MARVPGLFCAVALILGACGGGATSATSAPAAAAGEVVAQGFKFAPTSLEVKVGTKVNWTNKDGSAHTVTSGKPGAKDGKFDGELAPTTGTFSFTFAQAGTFDFFCSRHPTTMSGTIVVK